jgi:hypothetical protein
VLDTEGSLILDYLPDAPEMDYDAPFETYHPYTIRHIISLHMPEEWSNDLEPEVFTSAAATYRKRTELIRDSLFVIHHTLETNARHIGIEALQEFRDFRSKVEESVQVSLTYRYMPPGRHKAYLFTFGAVALGLLAGGLLCYRLYRYDPPPKTAVPGVSGIGGWLILPTIGLVLSPLRILVDIFGQDSSNLNDLNTLLQPENIPMFRGLMTLIFVEIVANTALLVYTILLIVLFFRTRSSVPRLMIGWYIGFSALFFGDLLAYEILNLDQDDEGSTADIAGIVRTLLVLMIWVPYFLYSERVRNTFVNRLGKSMKTDQVSSSEEAPVSG